MSYILDALRRADAERERGGVPGLHTQTMTEPSDEDVAARPPGLRPWHWIALGLAGGLAVAIVWSWRGDEPPPAPPPAPLPIQQPAPPLAEAAPAPAALPVPPPAPAPAGPVAIAPMRSAPPPPAASAPTAAAPAASIPRVGSLAELPAALRSGLPALAFGGSIYSSTPANRLLIVNGQLMHEGESLGPGVTLEQIRPKSAVLNIRGQRYEVGM